MLVNFRPDFITNVMILTSLLSIFESPLATYHLALPYSIYIYIYISQLNKTLQNAAHITTILDSSTNAWLIAFCFDATKTCGLKLLFMLVMEHTLLRMFLNIWGQLLFSGDQHDPAL